ncbi:hypothetical protein Tco_1219863 [Tanacetum coccineum]
MGVVSNTMTEPTSGEYNEEVRADYGSTTTTPWFNKNAKFKLRDEFLKILRDNAFNGINRDDVVDHTTKVMAILELIKRRNINELDEISVSDDEKNEQLDDGVCKSKKIEVTRYSLGTNEEYIAINTCEYDT